MIADYFTYDNISSRVYNLVIGSFSGSDDGTQETGKVDITTVKAPHSNTFLRANATYNNPIQMNFSIIKMNCTDVNDIIFSQREIAWILRWLGRKDYKELKFEQEGWENIHYNAILKVDEHMIGGQCMGFDVTAVCDAPWGYDQRQHFIIDASETGEKTVDIYDDSDEIGMLYPRVVIQVLEAGDIHLYNALTKTETVIKNCVANEKITLENNIIISTECEPNDSDAVYKYDGRHPTLFNDFNYQWLPIANSFTALNVRDARVNPITVTGKCTVDVSYCAPRKAVI